MVHLEGGFDFLGFNVRRYPTPAGGKLLIKPSSTAVTRIRHRITTEMRSLRGGNAVAVIRRLNPIIRGWSAYYRGVVSKEVFARVDHHLWQATYRWALRAHPNKSKQWATTRYFDAFNPSRTDRWVFGDRNSGLFMHRFVWTRIIRHSMVAGTSSPDDPALTAYWRNRRDTTAELGARVRLQARRQHGLCPVCGEPLVPGPAPQSPREWERWLVATRRSLHTQGLRRPDSGPLNSNRDSSARVVHTRCRNGRAKPVDAQPDHPKPRRPPGLA